MSRQALRAAGDDLFCRAVPPGHGGTNIVQTSGATGEPVVVRRTAVTNLYWMALTVRDHDWHGRDESGRLAVIRPSVPVDGVFPDWGQPLNLLGRTGCMYTMPLGSDVGMQGEWLTRVDPHYLLTFPANLAALLDWLSARQAVLPSLRAVRSLGETLTPALRARVRAQLGVPVTDSYSSQELGVIALECVEGGLYHVMAENVIVEILRDDDAPCAAGEIGRVVVTDLHNFATPLVRYDTGDRAEVGTPCPCGRGLPTLARVLGRARGMLRLPNGERRWPLVGFYEYQQIAPIRQYQLVQTSLSRIEVRFAVSPKLDEAQETQMRALIIRWLGAPFTLDFRYYTDAIPRDPSGKFEDFICLVPEGIVPDGMVPDGMVPDDA